MKTLYENGNILTMETWPMAQALVEEDGVIRYVGTREKAREFLDDTSRRVDLQGHTLMPAFIDPHSHLTACASALCMVQLSGCRSFQEIIDRVAAFLKERNVPAGAWVCGMGYDHNLLAEKRHPDRRVLDVFSENPVALTHQSGHMGAVNSRALELLGIIGETPDPAGGHIGREPDGAPSGYLEEAAYSLVTRQIPPPQPEERMAAFTMAEQEYLRRGITTIQDGMTGAGDFALLKKMDEENRLRADVVCYHSLKDEPELSDRNPDYDRQYGHHLKIGGYKLFLDGSPQGKTAWLSRPYEGETEYRGYPSCTDEEVLSAMEKALRDNRQILVHCNGDAAAQQMIDSYEKALRNTGCPNIRPVMIHAQLVRPDQLRVMGKLSMMASFFTAHVFHWGDVHLQNLGERAMEISPMHSAMNAGVCCTMHQDSPVIPPDMLESVWCAAVRKTRDGVQLDPKEKISVYDALRCVTINAACQYGEERTKGTLHPGKRADLVILDRNPLTVPVDEIPSLRVLETIKDGVSVYRAH